MFFLFYYLRLNKNVYIERVINITQPDDRSEHFVSSENKDSTMGQHVTIVIIDADL